MGLGDRANKNKAKLNKETNDNTLRHMQNP